MTIITSKKATALVVIAAMLLMAVLSGCQTTPAPSPSTTPTTVPTETTEPTTVPTTVPSESTAPDNRWSMQAVWVDRQGNILETTELTAEVMIWTQDDGGTYYSINFSYPAEMGNGASGVIPADEQDGPYYCCSGSNNDMVAFYCAFDPDLESFIVDYDDEKDEYLIAYRSDDHTVSELWNHFQDFFNLMPEDFPTVY